MGSVTVTRFGGDKQGEPVVEPLATAQSTKVNLGTSIIDEKSLDGLEKTIKVPYVPTMFVGAIVKVREDTVGKVLVGKVTAFEHMFSGVEQFTTITVRGVVA
ncbi:hypothetical protein [Vibrio phage V-YDF132]|nr:hypothetical protein [Vibrio phage V-YDF132]